MKQSFVYIMTCRFNTTLHIGVTNDLFRRVQEHKEHLNRGFTKRYNLNKLVYFEQFVCIEEAIRREKQLNGGSRYREVELIVERNPGWVDLAIRWKR
jgi:putative endonuclease